MSSGRVVVVTGASGGVGRAVARRFAAAGDRVVLLARGADGLDAAADDVARRWGPVEVWVNNAFAGALAPVTALTPAEVRRITEITYLGYVHGTMAALRQTMPRDRGTIVHVGSALGYRGIPLQSAYCGAKHAIKGFHQSLRCELLHTKSGVRTTMVVLPALNTPQFEWVRSTLPRRAQPVPPIYQPEVAAIAVVHAANHPRRREYWVGGSTVGTVLANRFAPGLMDRYLARTGFDSQQTDEPDQAPRPDNLLAPADDAPGADHGAHGRFDDQAAGRCVQPWLSRHRGTVAGLTAATAALTAGLLRRSAR